MTAALIMLLTLGASAAEYRTGEVTTDRMDVTIVERGPKERIVFVNTSLPGMTGAVTDVASARLMKEFGLERSQLLFRSTNPSIEPTVNLADEMVTLAREAFETVRPQQKQALFGMAISGPIRSAFQVVEHRSLSGDPLTDKTPKRNFYPVQAVAFGNKLIVIGLGGRPAASLEMQLRNEFSRTKIVWLGNSNDVGAVAPDDILETIRAVVKRVQ